MTSEELKDKLSNTTIELSADDAKLHKIMKDIASNKVNVLIARSKIDDIEESQTNILREIEELKKINKAFKNIIIALSISNTVIAVISLLSLFILLIGR